ncbi:MAG: PilZ domain [Gaiellales bacterium]|jgi:c-di-GMP-binding flagellar brake protein YcgR|nr:PilZ domain [Gaiellales bacterium]MDX6545719.1 PilZ domain [Gaiellales bacterium]MDX6550026.1 PilZ domain [Gaiellales bacterium]
MTSERRAFLRVEADLTVICQRIDGAGGREQPVTRRTIDISAGGLRLADRAGLAPGDRAWLEVQFREPHFLIFSQAKVVWVDDKGAAGIRFDELETYTQQRVIRWVYGQDRRLFDRRSRARIPMRLKAVVRRIADDGHAVEEFAAPTLDLSVDGVRITTERLLDVDAQVEIEIEFGDSLPPFAHKARVAWGDETGGHLTFGLAFADIHPAQQRQLIERTLAAEKRLSP